MRSASVFRILICLVGLGFSNVASALLIAGSGIVPPPGPPYKPGGQIAGSVSISGARTGLPAVVDTVQVYISSIEDSITAGARFVGNITATIPEGQFGGPISPKKIFDIPSTLVPGDYFLVFSIDSSVSSHSFVLTPLDPASLEFISPNNTNDLLIVSNDETALSDQEGSFPEGQSVSLRWRVRNTGELPSALPHSVQFTLNGDSIGSQDLPSPFGALAQTVIITNNIPSSLLVPGTNRIQLEITGGNEGVVFSIDEFFFVEGPDLSPSSLMVTSQNLYGNDVLTSSDNPVISFDVDNLGEVDTRIVFRVGIQIENVITGLVEGDFFIDVNQVVNASSAFSSGRLVLPKLAAGNYQVTILADTEIGGVGIDETNEGNNEALASFTVVDSFTIDADSDTLLDAWEIANGLDPTSIADAFMDSDLDGNPNWLEFRAGTDPNDASENVRTTVFNGENGPTMRINRLVPNVQYQIERTSNISDGWAVLVTSLGSSFSLNGIVVDGTIQLPPIGNGSEFYRLAQTGIDLPPQP